MRELKEKRRIRKFLFSKVTIGVLLVIFSLLLSATWSVFGKYQETKGNKENAERSLIRLIEQATHLESEIVRLNTDRGIEEEIRNNFGFVKEDEQVIIIVHNDPLSDEDQSRKRRGFFSRIMAGVAQIFSRN